jgi:glycosyltransferase involved in cell wall biosynthesis
MHILKIVPQAFYSARGTPLSAYHRARELIARGHEVDILTYGVGADPPGLAVRVFRARGPHFKRTIAAGPSRLKIWFDCLLFATLLVRLCRVRYDVLYAHEEGALLARLAGALFRIPYIYDMHSSLPLQITDWKFSSRPSVIALFRWVERLSVRGACAVVAISPAVARVANLAGPDTPCVVLANHFAVDYVIPPDEIAAVRARYNIPLECKLVLYTGSFVALQALDLLLEAIPEVLASVPNTLFLLVGGTEPEIDALSAHARRLGVSDHVVFERSLPQQAIPAYLAAADALVSPRTQGINPPGKLLSYLASGKPVVATNTLVHNQLLNDQCAILTSPDARGLAQGLLTGLTDPVRVAGVVKGAANLLRRFSTKAERDAAYATVLDAARGARVAKAGLFGRLHRHGVRGPTASRRAESDPLDFDR